MKKQELDYNTYYGRDYQDTRPICPYCNIRMKELDVDNNFDNRCQKCGTTKTEAIELINDLNQLIGEV